MLYLFLLCCRFVRLLLIGFLAVGKRAALAPGLQLLLARELPRALPKRYPTTLRPPTDRSGHELVLVIEVLGGRRCKVARLRPLRSGRLRFRAGKQIGLLLKHILQLPRFNRRPLIRLIGEIGVLRQLGLRSYVLLHLLVGSLILDIDAQPAMPGLRGSRLMIFSLMETCQLILASAEELRLLLAQCLLHVQVLLFNGALARRDLLLWVHVLLLMQLVIEPADEAMRHQLLALLSHH